MHVPRRIVNRQSAIAEAATQQAIRGGAMGEVIAFRSRVADLVHDEEPEIDLVTAIDVAIRDLHDIESGLTAEAARERAQECRLLLSGALHRAGF
jgi:hypothetical protein